MTVSSAIIAWLKTFEVEEYWKMNHIDTDFMHGNVDYVLMKEPVVNVRKFISGTEIHTEYYQFCARLPAQTNDEAVDNGAWLEALEKWIAVQNEKKQFPVLQEAEVQQTGISTSYSSGRNAAGEALYTMTIFIKYKKKGVQKL